MALTQAEKMVVGYVKRYPNEPDEPFTEFDIAADQVEENELDKPGGNVHLEPSSEHGLPPLVLGCGTFSSIYGGAPGSTASMYFRMTRLALRYGITAFDTAPHYHPSEILLGKCLYALRDEFPRDKYSIITKCGKYSPMKEDHVLDEDMLKACVARSLRRFKTDYLDVVYIHDAEFNSSITPPSGDPTRALDSSSTYDREYAVACGLEPGTKGQSRGEGDEKIINAVKVLRGLQAEGKIRKIGMAAYPLPGLLRLSTMILEQTGQPLDIIQTYSHANLQNNTLPAFLPYFENVAKVPIVMNASPLNMRLLTKTGAPQWHPAPEGMQECTRALAKDIPERAKKEGLADVGIEDLAVSFGMREFEIKDGQGVSVTRSAPVVVGVSSLEEVHTAVKSFLAVRNPTDKERDEKMKKLEIDVMQEIKAAGWANWSWESPVPNV